MVVVGAGLAVVAVVEPLWLEVVVTWIVQWSVLAVLQGLQDLLHPIRKMAFFLRRLILLIRLKRISKANK